MIPRDHSSIKKGQNICLPSFRNDTEHTTEPTFRENAEGLQSRRHQTPKRHYGKRPEDSHINATGISMKCGNRDNASNGQSQYAERNGKEAAVNDQTHFVMMEFRDFKRPSPPKCQDCKNASNQCCSTN